METTTIKTNPIQADEAREIMAISHAYKDSLIERFNEEIREQAEKGLNWAHLSFDVKESSTIIQRIKDVFVLMGYDVKSEGSKTITVKW